MGLTGRNPNASGGAVALGHPIGMTGTRLILMMMYELRRRGGKLGIATPCIDGGEATAVMVEVETVSLNR